MPYQYGKKNNNKHDRGLTLLGFLISFSVVCLIFLNLIQANSLVSQSYDIREKKGQIESLKNKNHDLEIEIAKLQSPVNLEKMIEDFNLVEVKEITYLENENAFAVKR